MNDLARAILELVDSLEMAPQSKLPTERELSDRLNASRWQIRSALDDLEKQGKIWRHVGKGTFLGRKPSFALQTVETLSHESSPVDILEARQAIEPMLAAMAAVRATPTQLKGLQALCEKLATATTNETYEILDEAFHLSIAEMARNQVMLSLFQIVNALRKEYLWESMRKSAFFRRRPEVRREHEDILAAIRSRDPERSEAAMRTHLSNMTDLYLNLPRGVSGLGSTLRDAKTGAGEE